MGIVYANKNIFWNYFLILENEFETIARFIEPCEDNNDTYSIELARLLMSAAQEVDVVLKAYCAILNGNKTAGNIGAYYSAIFTKNPDFLNVEVEIRQYGMRGKPWEDWTGSKCPVWWTANNKVKHHRQTDFNRATLKNTFNAIAAFKIAILHFYQADLQVKGDLPNWQTVSDQLRPVPTKYSVLIDTLDNSLI